MRAPVVRANFFLRAAWPWHAYLPRMTLVTVSPPIIRRAHAGDASLVARLAATTFADTFAADNDPHDMAAYASAAFGDAIQHRELSDAGTIVFLAEQGDVAVGYAMLRRHAGPACVLDRDAIELARLYVVRSAIGSGVGAALMQACLDEAAAQQRATIWLGVWERNVRAIAFYVRWGFADVGTHAFQLGADRQTDRVMARPVMGRPVMGRPVVEPR